METHSHVEERGREEGMDGQGKEEREIEMCERGENGALLITANGGVRGCALFLFLSAHFS